jgi:TonB family protein
MNIRVAIFECLVLISIFSCSESTDPIKNYERGVKAFNSNNFERAIKLFSLSINSKPNPEAYSYRAESYLNIGDTCNYCLDLLKITENPEWLILDNAAYFDYDLCKHTVISYEIPDSLKQAHPSIDHFIITYYRCSSDSISEIVSKNKDFTWSSDISDIQDEPLFIIAEVQPAFFGGDAARNKYFETNIKYPETARLNGIAGIVYVTFIVNSDGTISSVGLLKGIGSGCDEEALRLIRNMPKWKPGVQSGKKVRVRVNLPVYFKLPSQSK